MAQIYWYEKLNSHWTEIRAEHILNYNDKKEFSFQIRQLACFRTLSLGRIIFTVRLPKLGNTIFKIFN